MEGITLVVNETVQTFNSEYNLGKEMGKDMLYYCRPTVEKYLFTKLYDQLFAMYAALIFRLRIQRLTDLL